jgi:hypothetical protein
MWWRTVLANYEDRTSFPNLKLDDGPELSPEEDERRGEELFYHWDEQANNVGYQIVQDFLANPNKKQSWNVVPAARIIKIWKDFAKYGFVRDEKGLDQIAQIMIENTQKLYINTVLMEHTETSGQAYAEDYFDVEWNEDWDEKFPDHVEDEHGAWRISDYALKPLTSDSMQLMGESDPVRKLLIIDRMLNRIHARSDIAALFIEGGQNTLNQMFAG